MSRLVILAALVFEISCGKTDRETNTSENPTDCRQRRNEQLTQEFSTEAVNS